MAARTIAIAELNLVGQIIYYLSPTRFLNKIVYLFLIFSPNIFKFYKVDRKDTLN